MVVRLQGRNFVTITSTTALVGKNIPKTESSSETLTTRKRNVFSNVTNVLRVGHSKNYCPKLKYKDLNKSPIMLWSGKQSTVDHFRIFVMDGLMHIPKRKRSEWDRKSGKGFLSDIAKIKTSKKAIDEEIQQLIENEMTLVELPNERKKIFWLRKSLRPDWQQKVFL